MQARTLNELMAQNRGADRAIVEYRRWLARVVVDS